ncbi:hypothetical protein D3C85_1414470 [compost metagenome]
MKISDPGDYEAAVNKYGNDPSEESGVVRRTLARSLAENGPQALKASDIDNISSGNLEGKTLKSIVSKNVEDGVLSQEKIVIDSGGNLDYAFSATKETGRQRLKETANALKVNENLKGKIKHNASSIERMSNYTPSQIPGQGTFF